jgi:hypothetical protein
MSCGEDDVVSNKGAAAETRSVDEQCNLILELASGGQVAADDAVAVADNIVGTRGLCSGHGPYVGPVGGLKL